MYNRSTGLPYGKMLEVLGNGTFSMEGETVALRGGSSRFPYSVQDANITAKIEATVREYPNVLFEILLGKAPTDIAADATGDVSAVADLFGGSIVDGSNGLSTVTALAASEANLKFGKYIIKATGAATVNLYSMSNIDFSRGTDVSFQDDTLKLLAADITIIAGNTDVASLGLRFTGVGVPAFTTGHTASFYVLPIHSGAMEVVIGGSTDVFPEVGCMLLAQQQGNGEMFEIDVFRAKALGMDLGAQEKAFAETTISLEAFYDSTKSGIAKIRHVIPA
jgi:hypothetical protein